MQFSLLSVLLLAGFTAAEYPRKPVTEADYAQIVADLGLTAADPSSTMTGPGSGIPSYQNYTAPGAGGVLGIYTTLIETVSATFTVPSASLPSMGSADNTYSANLYVYIAYPGTCTDSIGVAATVNNGTSGYAPYFGPIGSPTPINLPVDAGDKVRVSLGLPNRGGPYQATFENLSKGTNFSQLAPSKCVATVAGWLVAANQFNISTLPKLSRYTIPRLAFKGPPDGGFNAGQILLTDSAEELSNGTPVIDCQFYRSRGLSCGFNN